MAGLNGIKTTPSTTTDVGVTTQSTTPTSVSTSLLAGIGGAPASAPTPGRVQNISVADMLESMAADISDGG